MSERPTDLVERLRAAGDDGGAAEVEELRARVVELEAALATTTGTMQFPPREEREKFRVEWNVPPNTPGHEPAPTPTSPPEEGI